MVKILISEQPQFSIKSETDFTLLVTVYLENVGLFL